MSITTTIPVKEWISPTAAGRLLGVKRDTLLKHASHWRIRVRTFPRARYRLRVVNHQDVLKFKAGLEATEEAAIRVASPSMETARPR